MANSKLTQTQQWTPGMRNSFVLHEPKREVAGLSASRKHRDEAVQQLTGGVTPEKAISKQTKIQTIGIKKVRSVFRISDKKPMVWMNGTKKLVKVSTEVGLPLPNSRKDSKPLAARS